MSVFEKSKFIWAQMPEEKNSYAEFFSEFENSGGKLLCRVSCDGDYTLFINGAPVSCNQYGDFEHYKIYNEVDISPFVRVGKNSFALLCWHFGEDIQRYKKYSAGVIFEVVENGLVTLASNESILARKSRAYISGSEKKISPQLGFSFAYDATKEDDWTLGGGGGMKKAVHVDKKCTFFKRPIKELSLAEAVFDKIISQDGDSRFLIDLGREYVGLLTLDLLAPYGTEITVSYGECLENGHVKRLIGGRDFSIDYTACGEDKYTNYMLRLACRYIEISTQSPIKLKSVGIIPQYYGVNEAECNFLTDKDRQIYDICVNTLRLCMMEHYVDCPWREQCLYAFDSRNQMLCGYYAFKDGNFEYSRANLLLFSKDERRDNLLSICAPCGCDFAIPSFSLYYILALREYLEHSGDASLIYEVEPKITGIIDAFLNNRQNGLVNKFPSGTYWSFYDWSPYSDGYFQKDEASVADAVINALVIIALDSYKKICSALSRPFGYESELCELRAAAKDAFFDTECGLFVMSDATRQYTELANSLCILAALCSEDEARHICKAMASGELIPCSLSMKCFKYDAYLSSSRELYKDVILNEIRADYEKMIPTGTVWETAEGASAFDNAGSLCHGWSAIPIYYYNILMK